MLLHSHLIEMLADARRTELLRHAQAWRLTHSTRSRRTSSRPIVFHTRQRARSSAPIEHARLGRRSHSARCPLQAATSGPATKKAQTGAAPPTLYPPDIH